MDIEEDKQEPANKENSGGYYKHLGNEEFEKGNYEAAITNYTKAIVKTKFLLVFIQNSSGNKWYWKCFSF